MNIKAVKEFIEKIKKVILSVIKDLGSLIYGVIKNLEPVVKAAVQFKYFWLIITGLIILSVFAFKPIRYLVKYNVWDVMHIKSEYFFNAGVRYEEKKYINYSIGSFKRSLNIQDGKFNINPNDLYQLESLYNLGVLYYQYLKNYTQAFFYFNEYMDIFDRLKTVNPNVRNVHEKDIMTVINYILALDDSSKNPAARDLKNKGNEAYFKKDFQNALKLYKDALMADPTYIEVYNNLATTYFQLGDFKNAVDFWKLTLLFMTDMSTPTKIQEALDLYINIALASEEHLKNYKDAMYYYEKYIEKAPVTDPGTEEAKRRIERLNRLISQKK